MIDRLDRITYPGPNLCVFFPKPFQGHMSENGLQFDVPEAALRLFESTERKSKDKIAPPSVSEDMETTTTFSIGKARLALAHQRYLHHRVCGIIGDAHLEHFLLLGVEDDNHAVPRGLCVQHLESMHVEWGGGGVIIMPATTPTR